MSHRLKSSTAAESLKQTVRYSLWVWRTQKLSRVEKTRAGVEAENSELAVLRANRARGRRGLVGCVGDREMVGWGQEVLLGTGGRGMGKVIRVKLDYLCSLS